jgi:hypothetical protein
LSNIVASAENLIFLISRKMKKSRSNGRGIFGRAYSPLHHGLLAAGNVVDAGLNTVGKVVNAGVYGLDRAGSAVAGHANATVSNVFHGISGLGGKRRRSTRRRRTHRR